MRDLIHIPSHRELIRSCHILFGLEVQATPAFLNYLQLSGIKTAFRQKAFATHPDIIARDCSLASNGSSHSFQDVKEAYDFLTGYIHRREKSSRLHKPYGSASFTPQNFSASNGNRHDHFFTDSTRMSGKNFPPGSGFQNNRTRSFFQGTPPPYPLLFGRFLYYSGIISWFNISQALVWQKTQRPLVGELSRKMGWLTMLETMQILKNGRNSQFGETAVQMGFLSEVQIRSILLRQKQLHKKIGSFFLEHDILTPEELQFLIVQQRLHNARFASN